MKTYTADELKEILRLHKLWLEDNNDGQRANLSGSNLRYADLSDSNLSDSNLSGSDLRYANLSGSNLSGSNLRYAKTENTRSNESTSFFALQCPEEGTFIGWKKCRNKVIVKLQILSSAKRSSATTRKCRCSKAKVLNVFGADYGISSNDSSFEYHKGETVSVDNFDEDRWNECSTGIHFFITRKEAEDYCL